MPAASAPRVAIRGSHVDHLGEHAQVGSVSGNETAMVTLLLRRKADLSFLDSQHELPVDQHRRLTPDQLGPDPRAVDAVRRFATDYGLLVLPDPPVRHRRAVVLVGQLRKLQVAFGLNGLARFRTQEGRRYIARSGPLTIPAELAKDVLSVWGIGDEQYGRVTRPSAESAAPSPGAAPVNGRTPEEYARAYGYPPHLTGRGTAGAILTLGGSLSAKDDPYYGSLGLKVPSFPWITVQGPGEQTGSADVELDLDVQVAYAMAPGATWMVCSGLDTLPGFVDTAAGAVHGGQVSVISASWTSPEPDWPVHLAVAMQEVLRDFAALGGTFVTGSGDRGDNSLLPVGPSANHPASSEFALAVGGTTATIVDGRLEQEEVWWVDPARKEASGFGTSRIFPMPRYQGGTMTGPGVSFRNRATPDVCLHANNLVGGWLVSVNGARRATGGTSAAGPAWAALIARYREAGLRIGWLHPYLYAAAIQPVNGETSVFNPVLDPTFPSTGVWGIRTGLGSPNGGRLLESLLRLQASGVPAA